MGDRRLITAAERQRVIDLGEWVSLTTMYGDLTVQHLGGTRTVTWALKQMQKNVCVERKKSSRDSQMKKYVIFTREEGRGLPPGEIDLVACASRLIYEGFGVSEVIRN